LSSRPPKAGTILDPALVGRLSEGACASLTADAPADRWAAVLDATAYSPVRLTVKPHSIPEKPSDELLASAKKLASRLPQIAAAFGIETNDGPAKPRGPRRPLPPRPPRPPIAPPEVAQAVEPAEQVAPESRLEAQVESVEDFKPPESVEHAEPPESVEQVEDVERTTEDELPRDL
jgi:hypothetical protein